MNRLAAPIERAQVLFTPDKLDAELRSEPFLLDGDDFYMARGPFPPEGKPLFVPITART